MLAFETQHGVSLRILRINQRNPCLNTRHLPGSSFPEISLMPVFVKTMSNSPLLTLGSRQNLVALARLLLMGLAAFAVVSTEAAKPGGGAKWMRDWIQIK